MRIAELKSKADKQRVDDVADPTDLTILKQLPRSGKTGEKCWYMFETVPVFHC